MNLNPNMYGTPEHYLASPEEIDIDAINCVLGRAAATVNMLFCNITSKEESKIPDQHIAYAIDAISGYLDQISILLNQEHNNHHGK